MYITVQCSSLHGCNFQLDINLPCINGLNTFHLSISLHVSFPSYNPPLGFVFFCRMTALSIFATFGILKKDIGWEFARRDIAGCIFQREFARIEFE